MWITTQVGEDSVRFAGVAVPMKDLTKVLGRLALDGSAHTFGNFIWFEGYVIVILLASILGILGSYGVAWFGIRINTVANSRAAFSALQGKPLATPAP